ncbi:ACP S-malonyltransferase [Flavobacterium sp. H122]|uniref:ACP S-malonyltransferase n=1 Tax=Flavobacterium sp. H122 TaxID=2529860 RepID=UPI0010A9E0FE|nr:ACP S-malonyltransferase [Flavobacterium sp. H122]
MKAIMFAGQGSQYKGMGKDLFKIYPMETKQASDILGYDLEELCVNDPQKLLGKTQFTQPALYVVNAFSYYKQQNQYNKPDYLIGHSLGEYNALLVAGAFDFATGLKLVQKRGSLMAAASGGGMAAVIGLDVDTLSQKLADNGFTGIDIANFNTPSQTVIAGQEEMINKVVKNFDNQGIKIIPLFVSAPFHSRYMKPAAEKFSSFLNEFNFSPLQIPVISNVTARPYSDDQIAALLSNQIESSVQWTDTVRLLMTKGVTDYEEIGGVILTKMVNEIKQKCSPIIIEEEKSVLAEEINIKHTIKSNDLSTRLGSKTFRDDYGIKYAYVSGAMYRGISSKELVVRMAKAKLLGFLGTGGMSLEKVEEDINYIQEKLRNEEAYGMNLLHNPMDMKAEMKFVELYIKKGIRKVEAAAFMQITPALVYYHLKGLRKNVDGSIMSDHKIIAKISRPEVAEAFMRPAPERIVNKLLDEGLVTIEQAELAKRIPISYDICVEADSAGHTDSGVAMVLLPSIQQLRMQIKNEYNYNKSINVGLAGGIGTPQAVACAFMMGADFVLTGSINQCTVDAGTSDLVKDLLQDINVQDTDYAPAGDMFELGAKIQVLKKGVLFPARANKLYTLYNQYNSLEEIPPKIVEGLEKNYFKKSIDTIWEETKNHLRNKGEISTIAEAEKNSKVKMALIFRRYFGYSTRLAFDGNESDKVNFQIHTGPSLGAFNQWVKGTSLENWRNRYADQIGIKMMDEAAFLIHEMLLKVSN